MKRLAVLVLLLTVGGVSMIFARQQQQASPQVSLELKKVKDNLYVIIGGGGNTAVLVTDKGVVVVDTKLPGMGPGILEKVKSITDKPVMMVINTHTHGDHVGSNSAFTGAVEFVAQENCKASMEKMAAFQTDEGKKFLPGDQGYKAFRGWIEDYAKTVRDGYTTAASLGPLERRLVAGRPDL